MGLLLCFTIRLPYISLYVVPYSAWNGKKGKEC